MRTGDLLNSKFAQTSFQGPSNFFDTQERSAESCVDFLESWRQLHSQYLQATSQVGALKSPVPLALPIRAEVLLVGLNPFTSELADGMEHVLGRDRDLSGPETSVLLPSGTRPDRHDFQPPHLLCLTTANGSQQITWSCVELSC